MRREGNEERRNREERHRKRGRGGRRESEGFKWNIGKGSERKDTLWVSKNVEMRKNERQIER